MATLTDDLAKRLAQHDGCSRFGTVDFALLEAVRLTRETPNTDTHVEARSHLRAAFDLLGNDAGEGDMDSVRCIAKARTLITQAAFAVTTIIGDATDTKKQVCDAAWGGHSK